MSYHRSSEKAAKKNHFRRGPHTFYPQPYSDYPDQPPRQTNSLGRRLTEHVPHIPHHLVTEIILEGDATLTLSEPTFDFTLTNGKGRILPDAKVLPPIPSLIRTRFDILSSRNLKKVGQDISTLEAEIADLRKRYDAAKHLAERHRQRKEEERKNREREINRQRREVNRQVRQVDKPVVPATQVIVKPLVKLSSDTGDDDYRAKCEWKTERPESIWDFN